MQIYETNLLFLCIGSGAIGCFTLFAGVQEGPAAAQLFKK